MKTSLTSALITLAGLASASLSQQTSLEMQVSKDGINWSNAVSVDRSAGDTGRVLIRTVVTWVSGTSTSVPIAFASITYQPVIGNPRPGIDVIAPFANTGNNTNGGSIIPDILPMDGPFGRLSPFASTGPASSNPASNGNRYDVITHTGGSGGAPDGTFYRIARNDISRWAGTGSTTGAAAVNNFNGAGGIACVQKSSGNVNPTTDPAFLAGITNIEIFRIALDTGSGPWEMQVLAPTEGMSRNTSTGIRQGAWFSSGTDNSGSIKGEVVVTPASISIVPAPGTLGLLAPIGLLAVRRKRQSA